MGPTGTTKQRVEQILGPQNEVHATAIVKLYTSNGGSWEWSHVTGAAALVTNKSENTKFIHVVDLNAHTIPFSQELYEHFAYEANRDFFHTFEMDDCVAGLSFADIQEARTFQTSVVAAPAVGNARQPPLPPVPNRPAAGTMGQRPPATPPKPAPPSPVTVAPIPPPLHVEPVHAPQPAYQPPPPQQAPQQQSPVPAKPKEEPKKKPSKGFFGKLKSALVGDDIPEDFAISDPKGFRHESHIGWDPNAGFEIRNIPPEWRKLFQAAGVKKSELRDAETAKFVMNVIGDTILQNGGTLPDAGPMMSAPPPAMGMPPPPPPMGMPPPPPPAPAAPPPPPAPGQAPPRAPAQPRAAPAPPPPNPRNDLLNAIQQGTNLRKVEAKDPGALPDLGKLNPSQSNTLVNTLAAAMAARRPAVQVEEEEEDNEEDEWSD